MDPVARVVRMIVALVAIHVWTAVSRLDRSGKCCGLLTKRDFERHPVWKFDTSSEGVRWRGEEWVQPVSALPVTSLDGCLIGTSVRLANGTSVFAELGNVDLRDAKSTSRSLTLRVYYERKTFWLDRFHQHPEQKDIASKVWAILLGLGRHREVNPTELASALGLKLTDVFPITYDLTGIATGPAEAIRGIIRAEATDWYDYIEPVEEDS